MTKRLLPSPRSWLSFALAALLLAGCGKNEENPLARPITLQLNWKAEPEFGGFYAAREIGSFKSRGLNVQIVEGGVGTPTIQMVGAGKADFGVGSADEVLIARSQGNHVVAIFAAFQTDPHALMAHASRKLKGIEDLLDHPGTIGLEAGYPYAMYLKHRFGFGKVHIVPSPGGDLSSFRNDVNFAQQCFITSEPVLARKEGLDAEAFLVADTGYNPYTGVVVVQEDFLHKYPDVTKAFALACREGWETYQNDPGPTDRELYKLNPSISPDVLAESAKLQDKLVRPPGFKDPIGSMTLDRWETLGKQLVEAGVIDKAPPARECFMNPEEIGGK